MLTRKTNIFFALMAIVAISFSFRVAPADFNGTWKLNEGKSELGQFGARGAASKFVIDQKTDAISITRTTDFGQGENNATDKLSSDGKESESPGFGNSKKKSTVKWAADGQSFTVTYVISGDFGGNSFEWKGSEVWTMAADGKSLTVANNLALPQGEVSTKAVYEKQ